LPTFERRHRDPHGAVMRIRALLKDGFEIERIPIHAGDVAKKEKHAGPLDAAKLHADDMTGPLHECEQSACADWDGI
jgi:hypothetical protein